MITVENYKKALEKMALSDNEVAILRAHYRAPDRRITMGKLAEEVGLKNYSVSNLIYGKLAHKLCDQMNAEPDDSFKDGRPFWLSIIAEAWENKEGKYEFQMWPELAEAMEELSLA
ncbi:hypothetical protein [uncultured Desulfobacter sp.]|uniref:hypothetical protein n=1 Tax=uncultured Desulfobacter sp. TaxID=240139 RepID=UPI0029C95F64|nr:hypothetical protein [uncultured Desulfobacter sp.]